MQVCGIDEAGRGPVIGPMVMAGVLVGKDKAAELKKLGVKDVAFSKRCGLRLSDMVRSSWVYKRLRNFRAGIEGVISFLKRCFGLGKFN